MLDDDICNRKIEFKAKSEIIKRNRNYKEIDKKIWRVLKCKVKTTQLVETIFNFLPGEANFPYSGNEFFNECFIPNRGNGFSGKYKS